MSDYNLSQLKQLEAESIRILRDAVNQCENPIMLYSIGKDSSVMVRLAQKAFYPSKLPFKLLHIDSTWKFKEMLSFRDEFCKKEGLELIVHSNEKGRAAGASPFILGSRKYTDTMKTKALLEALDIHKFDLAFGGARRDEEKSRAKERVYSFRDAHHQWDPKNQRPELWSLFNAKINHDESIRVFPISNWTELDIWQYIRMEKIPIVPLYYAAKRKVVRRNGVLIMPDDDRMQLEEGEVLEEKMVRFRTLGCYPLTGAIESDADTVEKIVAEMMQTRLSERTTRVIDYDGDSSMEQKKREGYF